MRVAVTCLAIAAATITPYRLDVDRVDVLREDDVVR